MLKPQTHIRIDFSGTCALGPGKISLDYLLCRTLKADPMPAPIADAWAWGWAALALGIPFAMLIPAVGAVLILLALALFAFARFARA